MGTFASLKRLLLGCGLVSALGMTGCSLDLDPDTLVRELRVLGLRIGDPQAQSTAEVQANLVPKDGSFDLVFPSDHVTLSALVGAPTGPGRRLAAPQPLAYDWYLCVGIRSLFSPGSVDPACRKWAVTDPDPKKNPSLVYLQSGSSVAVPTTVISGIVLNILQTLLLGGGSGGTGGTGGTTKIPTEPVVLVLPVMMRVSVVGGDPNDSRNSEVSYTFLKITVALPGMTLPVANKNPALAAMSAGPEKEGAMQALQPCAADGQCPRYQLRRDEGIFLTPTLQDGSIEKYLQATDTNPMEKAETVRYIWFASDGEYTEARSGNAQPQTQWQNTEKFAAPADTNIVKLWLVAQDVRGGVDWQSYELQLTN